VFLVPDTIASEEQLENVLAAPYPETVDLMRRLEGDILILGAGGKMGPSLAHLAREAVRAAGVPKRVIAVSRFSERERLARVGVETIACDLLDEAALRTLPRARNVIFMAGRKFGVLGAEAAFWTTNAVLPADVARTFCDANIVAFSTGCVYALVAPATGGSVETDPIAPVGEYAWSCAARERVLEHFAGRHGTKMLFFRLNWAIDLRYGVLLDVAQSVFARRPVDVTVNAANMIWQGDANNRVLLCLQHTANPPAALNVTGPELLSIEALAREFGQRFGVEVAFVGVDLGRAYLSNAARSIALFGPPKVSVARMIDWVADWVARGGRTLGKPTHYQVTDGQFLSARSEGGAH